MTLQKLIALALRAGVGLLAIAALAWPADWLIWRLRGQPTADVEVNQYTTASLKGNKLDYYIDGRVTLPCSRSFLPEENTPCWYLRRHTDQVTSY